MDLDFNLLTEIADVSRGATRAKQEPVRTSLNPARPPNVCVLHVHVVFSDHWSYNLNS